MALINNQGDDWIEVDGYGRISKDEYNDLLDKGSIRLINRDESGKVVSQTFNIPATGEKITTSYDPEEIMSLRQLAAEKVKSTGLERPQLYNEPKTLKDYAELVTRQDFEEKSRQSDEERQKQELRERFEAMREPIIDFDKQRREQMNAPVISHDDRGFETKEENPVGKIYNYLVNTEGKDSAEKYYKTITPELNKANRALQDERMYEQAYENPALGAAASLVMLPTKPFEFGAQALSKLATGKIDENDPMFGGTRASQAAISGASKRVGEWYAPTAKQMKYSTLVESGWTPEKAQEYVNSLDNSLYEHEGQVGFGTAYSLAEFALSMVMGNAIAGNHLGNGAYIADGLTAKEAAKKASDFASNISLLVQSSGAASSTVLESKDNGMSDEQALILGSIAGFAEWITEKVSIDAWLDPEKNLLKGQTFKYIVKNMASEGAEEFASDMINIIADTFVAGDKSDFSKRMGELKAEGKSEAEAFGIWVAEKLMSGGESALAGAISGLVVGSFGGVSNYVRGNNLVKSSNLNDTDNLNELINKGLSYEGTLSSELAQRLQNTQNEGRPISNTEIAGLYNAVAEERQNHIEKEDVANRIFNAAANRSEVAQYIDNSSLDLDMGITTVLDRMHIQGQSVPEYVQEMVDIYLAGLRGDDKDGLKSDILNEAQIDAAYEYGSEERSSNELMDETEETTTETPEEKAETPAKEVPVEDGSYWGWDEPEIPDTNKASEDMEELELPTEQTEEPVNTTTEEQTAEKPSNEPVEATKEEEVQKPTKQKEKPSTGQTTSETGATSGNTLIQDAITNYNSNRSEKETFSDDLVKAINEGSKDITSDTADDYVNAMKMVYDAGREGRSDDEIDLYTDDADEKALRKAYELGVADGNKERVETKPTAKEEVKPETKPETKAEEPTAKGRLGVREAAENFRYVARERGGIDLSDDFFDNIANGESDYDTVLETVQAWEDNGDIDEADFPNGFRELERLAEQLDEYMEEGTPIKYSKKSAPSNAKATDDKGRPIAKQMQEYMKNSYARTDFTKDGQLKEMNHGTRTGTFTIFQGTSNGPGYFFSDSEETSTSYSDNNMDITPDRPMSFDDMNDFLEEISYGKYYIQKGQAANSRIRIREKETIKPTSRLANAVNEFLDILKECDPQNASMYDLGFMNLWLYDEENKTYLSAKELAEDIINGRNLLVGDLAMLEEDKSMLLEYGEQIDDANMFDEMKTLGVDELPVRDGEVFDNVAALQKRIYDFFAEEGKAVGYNGIYKAYLNCEKPLIIEGNGANWYDITLPVDNDLKDEIVNAKVRFIELMNKAEPYNPDYKNAARFDKLLSEYEKNKGVENLADDIDMHLDYLSEKENNLLTKEEMREISRLANLLEEKIEQGILVTSLTYDKKYSTNQINKYAYENGYDSVIFKDIWDGGDPDVDGTSNVIVVFKPEQIKSIYNQTPTTNPDIRYKKKTKPTATSEDKIQHFNDVYGDKSEWTTTRDGDVNKKPMSLTDIVNKIQHDFGVNITTGHMRAPDGVVGQFNRRDKSIRQRIRNSLPTISHELGHWLDDKYGLTKGKLDKKVKQDLLKALGKGKENYSPKEYIAEGQAEFIKSYLTNRNETTARYPAATENMLTKLTPKELATIDGIADEINAYYSINTGLESEIVSKEHKYNDPRNVKEKLLDTKLKKYIKWIDSNYAIKVVNSDAYTLATNAAYAGNRVANMIKNELTDSEGKFVYKGLAQVLAPIDITNEDMYHLFNDYLVYQHGIERVQNGKRVFANDAKNTVEYMQERINEIEAEHPEFKEVAEDLWQFEDKLVQEWAVNTGLISKETYKAWKAKYQKHVPLYRVMDDVKGKREVGVYRGAKRGFANQTSTLKSTSRQGSGRDIIYPVDNIMDEISNLVTASTRNEVMVSLRDAALNTDNGIFADIMEKVETPMRGTTVNAESLKTQFDKVLKQAVVEGKINGATLEYLDETIDGLNFMVTQFTKGTNKDDRVVSVMVDGKQEFWKINDPMLLESLTHMTKPNIEGLLKWYGNTTRFLTANITGNNPIWSIFSNAPRDLGTFIAYMKKKDFRAAFKDMAIAYINEFNDKFHFGEVNPLHAEYLAMGGGHDSMYSVDRDMAKKARKDITSNKRRQVLSMINPINFVSFMTDMIENGPREATYIMCRNQGMSPQEAFYESRDITVNFAKSGTMSRQVNQVIPFFNASLQGIDKMGRYFSAEDIKGKDRAKVALQRTGMLVTVSAMLAALTYALNNKDDKDKDNYQMLSNYTKNSYFNIPMGDGKYFCIPKPREIAVLVSLFERTLESTAGGNEKAFNEFWDYVADNCLPGVIAQVAKYPTNIAKDGFDKASDELFGDALGDFGVLGVFADISANRDFLGRPIVGQRLQNLEAKDQYNGATSKIALAIGKALNYSPQKIDYIGKNVLGYIWKIQNAWLPVDDSKRDPSMGVANSYVKDIRYSNDLTNELYDLADKSAKAFASDKENIDKEITKTLDNRMTTFWNNFNSLNKDGGSSDTRMEVLNMIKEYIDARDKDVTSALKMIKDVVRETKNTDLLPATMQKTVKNSNKQEFTLSDSAYREYQTEYSGKFYTEVEKNYKSSMTTDEKEVLIKSAKEAAKSYADNLMLKRYGSGSVEEKTTKTYDEIKKSVADAEKKEKKSNTDITTNPIRKKYTSSQAWNSLPKSFQEEIDNRLMNVTIGDTGKETTELKAKLNAAKSYGYTEDQWFEYMVQRKAIRLSHGKTDSSYSTAEKREAAQRAGMNYNHVVAISKAKE